MAIMRWLEKSMQIWDGGLRAKEAKNKK